MEEIYHLKGTPYHDGSELYRKNKNKNRSTITFEGPLRIISELEAFIISSSFVDTAIGVVFATFFGEMMRSFIEGFTVPLLSFLLGGVAMDHLYFTLKQPSHIPEGTIFNPTTSTYLQAKLAGAIVIPYGVLLSNLANFFVVACILFFVARFVNKFRKTKKKQKECPMCCSLIANKARRCPLCCSDISKPYGDTSQTLEMKKEA